MATVDGTGWDREVYKPRYGEVAVAMSRYATPGALSAADVVRLFKLPESAVVLDGKMRGPDVDSNATETFEFDIGTPSDPDYWLNSGVLTGDAVAPIISVGVMREMEAFWYTGTGASGLADPLTTETTVQGTVTAAAATDADLGDLAVLFYYTSDE